MWVIFCLLLFRKENKRQRERQKKGQRCQHLRGDCPEEGRNPHGAAQSPVWALLDIAITPSNLLVIIFALFLYLSINRPIFKSMAVWFAGRWHHKTGWRHVDRTHGGGGEKREAGGEKPKEGSISAERGPREEGRTVWARSGRPQKISP